MMTVYIFTFPAQWLENRKVVRGEQSFPITLPSGLLDVHEAIAACQIVAAAAGTILFPEQNVQVRTFVTEMEGTPLWDDCGIKVY